MDQIARRYDHAIDHYQRALELDPKLPSTHMYLAQTLEQTGRVEQALLEYEANDTLLRQKQFCEGDEGACVCRLGE